MRRSTARQYPQRSTAGLLGLATRHPFRGNAPLHARHGGFALRNASYGQAGSLRLAGAFSRTRRPTRSSEVCMSVVGASRRSAAPGVQFIGAAGYYGSSGLVLCHGVGAVGGRSPRPYRSESSVARHRAMPNPSIERTSQGLRPCAASHLKRWASRNLSLWSESKCEHVFVASKRGSPVFAAFQDRFAWRSHEAFVLEAMRRFLQGMKALR